MNAAMSEWLAQSVPDIESPQGFVTLLYFAGAGLITLGIETLRRWVKHRMDVWERRNPLPPPPDWERDDDA